jgi:hypothetical protein
MAKLLESGAEVTALHNHLLRANPPTFYMHVGGTGDPSKLATAIRAAWRPRRRLSPDRRPATRHHSISTQRRSTRR